MTIIFRASSLFSLVLQKTREKPSSSRGTILSTHRKLSSLPIFFNAHVYVVKSYKKIIVPQTIIISFKDSLNNSKAYPVNSVQHTYKPYWWEYPSVPPSPPPQGLPVCWSYQKVSNLVMVAIILWFIIPYVNLFTLLFKGVAIRRWWVAGGGRGGGWVQKHKTIPVKVWVKYKICLAISTKKIPSQEKMETCHSI